ncbi:MAG TPA: hypothetical protein VG674_23310 [Amycolatopsis sp.]|nr:hypothetical protein [Amycolatopsis sp.]
MKTWTKVALAKVTTVTTVTAITVLTGLALSATVASADVPDNSGTLTWEITGSAIG